MGGKPARSGAKREEAVTKTEDTLPPARHLLLHLSLKKSTVVMTKDVPDGNELCLGPWRVTVVKAGNLTPQAKPGSAVAFL